MPYLLIFIYEKLKNKMSNAVFYILLAIYKQTK